MKSCQRCGAWSGLSSQIYSWIFIFEPLKLISGCFFFCLLMLQWLPVYMLAPDWTDVRDWTELLLFPSDRFTHHFGSLVLPTSVFRFCSAVFWEFISWIYEANQQQWNKKRGPPEPGRTSFFIPIIRVRLSDQRPGSQPIREQEIHLLRLTSTDLLMWELLLVYSSFLTCLMSYF